MPFVQLQRYLDWLHCTKLILIIVINCYLPVDHHYQTVVLKHMISSHYNLQPTLLQHELSPYQHGCDLDIRQNQRQICARGNDNYAERRYVVSFPNDCRQSAIGGEMTRQSGFPTPPVMSHSIHFRWAQLAQKVPDRLFGEFNFVLFDIWHQRAVWIYHVCMRSNFVSGFCDKGESGDKNERICSQSFIGWWSSQIICLMNWNDISFL